MSDQTTISNDLIYKTLLDQNQELGTIKEKLSNIEIQTTKTNGRVTVLEGNVSLLQENKKGQVIIATFKKRSLAIFGTVVLVVWAVASIFLNAWVQKLFRH